MRPEYQHALALGLMIAILTMLREGIGWLVNKAKPHIPDGVAKRMAYRTGTPLLAIFGILFIFALLWFLMASGE